MQCWIIGSGPAALVAATHLSTAGVEVHIAERRAAPGWKLLVAGASGLNVTYDCPPEQLSSFYFARREELAKCFTQFGQKDWLELLESLEEPTFLGSSRRYFLKNKTAGGLLSTWKARLEAKGVRFHFDHELMDAEAQEGSVKLRFRSGQEVSTSAVLLALGGPSWENTPPPWPEIFTRRGIAFTPFTPANAGYSFRAPEGFFRAHEGKPIKGLKLTTARGSRQGELMITNYGLEGTPIYTMGCPGPATLDLKPDLAEAKLVERLRSEKNFAKAAKLSEGALAIFQALAPPTQSAEEKAKWLKALPIDLLEPRSLADSISARGGVSWDELSENLELKKMPRIFCAGEMVDWDAPTGGFLIQASVSMGHVAAQAIALKLKR